MRIRFRHALSFLVGAALTNQMLFAVSKSAGDQEAGKTPEAKKDSTDEKTMRALIADLGHESFDKRDAAHKTLLNIGGPALELLKKTANESADAEARERATELIEAIQELGLRAFRVDYYHDFRNKGFPNKKFALVGPGAATMVKSEPEGLRITLPAKKNVDAIGVTAEFPIKGDFEITVGYEIVKAARQVTGWRAGLELYFMTETANKEALAFDRAVRRDGRDVYACSRMTRQEGKRENIYKGEDMPASGKSGQMRVIRTGSRVVLSVREENAKEFRVVHRTELGKEDIKLIRLAANPGGAAAAVDLRLRDIRVRCADAHGLKTQVQVKTPSTK